MKLHQHFTLNFAFIFIISIFFTAFISYYTLQEINTKQYETRIKTQMELIKLELPNIKNLNAFVKEVKKKTQTRITIINAKGVVFVESDFNPAKMENHLHRPEIQEALKEGEGYTLRHSKTLNIDFLYMASKMSLKGKPIFVRLSIRLESIHKQFLSMWLRIITIISLSIFFGMLIIYKLNSKISKEIKKVTHTLDEIANKNYKASVDSKFADEFKQIESHIKKLSNKLEKREKQKRKYNAKIRLISKQRSDIISAISHEFKNPIASIIGYAQTLLDDPNANITIKNRFLQKIVKNSNKISGMIDRLSLATKFENGDLTPILTQFNLYELTKDVLNTFEDKHKERDFELRGKETLIKADKTMIEMVLINLIDNAIKYSEDTIFIEIDDNSLHVKDKGIGINEKDLEKVTNKFYRSNTLSWDNSIGLGLALVKHILTLHHTTLKIESKPGFGSDFSFEYK